ncbi:MAG: hypothetical protein A3G41_06510 [Elusimicrobia bacterium RIFCSPLOWO2_12_FULL_59_9]|nr:MAG: hypothetical protein A3G41_06510 [Elusimicrobia bacterium RIFCSPLOWO2_12_FULL_59_9]
MGRSFLLSLLLIFQGSSLRAELLNSAAVAAIEEDLSRGNVDGAQESLDQAFDKADAVPAAVHVDKGMSMGFSAGVPVGRGVVGGGSGTADIAAPLNDHGLSFKAYVGNQSAMYDERINPHTGEKMWTELVAFMPLGLEQNLWGVSFNGKDGSAVISVVPFVGAGLAVGTVQILENLGASDLDGNGDLGRNRSLATSYGSAGIKLVHKSGPTMAFLVQQIQNTVHHRHDATFVGGTFSWNFQRREK